MPTITDMLYNMTLTSILVNKLLDLNLQTNINCLFFITFNQTKQMLRPKVYDKHGEEFLDPKGEIIFCRFFFLGGGGKSVH